MFWERFTDGLIENVLFEFEAVGEDEIWIQDEKSSIDTWRDPEHEVSVVFAVIEETFISSEKVTLIMVLIDWNDDPSDGEVEVTEGFVVSIPDFSPATV